MSVKWINCFRAGYSLNEPSGANRPQRGRFWLAGRSRIFFASDLIQSAIGPVVGPIRELERADNAALIKFVGAGEEKLGSA